MEKLLAAYTDSMSLERIIEAAERVKVYAAKHPMSVSLLTPDEVSIYRRAILTVTGLEE